MDQRVVFTTPVGETPDYFGISLRVPFRLTLPTPSFGLRFIRENVSGVEVLEYPSMRLFERKLREGVDVLGISFYMTDVPLVKEMVRLARDHGVGEVWGGNYGVMCDEVKPIFDRVFVGYSEDKLSRILNGGGVDRLRHPMLDTRIGLRFPPLSVKYGFLFTSRGCPYRCSFCQTVAFTHETSLIPVESIGEVLDRYLENNIRFVFIMDENSFMNKSHAEKVISLLDEKGFVWGVCTRAENLHGRVAELRDRGMVDCIIGIESLSQHHHDVLGKNTDLNLLLETVKELVENNIYIHGTYIIGFEDDTKESIKQDATELRKLGISSLQVCVLTPFPHTPLWDELDSKYGIVKDDYSRFDAYHLTWNHPNFTFSEMDGLCRRVWRESYTPPRMLEGLLRLHKNSFFKRTWRTVF